MDMNGSGNGWTEPGSVLEASAAALAGFLAGPLLDGEWPLLDILLRLVLGQ
jgi:hypothetical protein